jgi:hypothetical protein
MTVQQVTVHTWYNATAHSLQPGGWVQVEVRRGQRRLPHRHSQQCVSVPSDRCSSVVKLPAGSPPGTRTPTRLQVYCRMWVGGGWVGGLGGVGAPGGRGV